MNRRQSNWGWGFILSSLFILSKSVMWKRLEFSVPSCLRGEFLPLPTILMHAQHSQPRASHVSVANADREADTNGKSDHPLG